MVGSKNRSCFENVRMEDGLQSNDMASQLLQLKDAQVRRDGKIILAVDSFSISEGESLVLLGPNGAGKSTFVGLVTREIFPLHRDDPPVVFRGQPRMLLTEAKACTGVVSSTMQNQIRVHLPAIDIVAGGLFGALGIPKHVNMTEAHRQKSLETMEELGIADLAERDVLTLSTGQARRVLVARALVNEPDILVFDEPCSGLDPQGMYHVRSTINDLARRGRSVLLVTHYLEDIVPAIDRVVLLKDGTIIGDGDKAEMLSSDRISKLFDVPAKVIARKDSYYMEFDYE